MVVMRPVRTWNLSLRVLMKGARKLVVQEALEINLASDLSSELIKKNIKSEYSIS